MFVKTTGYRTWNVTFFKENYFEVVTYPNVVGQVKGPSYDILFPRVTLLIV